MYGGGPTRDSGGDGAKETRGCIWATNERAGTAIHANTVRTGA